MASLRFYAFVAIVAAVALMATDAAAKQTTNFGAVVGALPAFQPGGVGGFRPVPRDPPTLAATSHGLFLSALYGLDADISAAGALAYVSALQNSDAGFGRQAGAASDLQATRDAVFAFRYAGMTIPNAEAVAAFVESTRDSSNGLYADTVGAAGNLVSTAHALQILDAAGATGDADRSAVHAALKAALEAGEGHYFAFDAPIDEATQMLRLPLEKASYGVIAAQLSGFEMDATVRTTLAQFLASQQARQQHDRANFGGFIADPEAAEPQASLVGTALAIDALRALGISEGISVDGRALLRYLKRVPMNLDAAFFAHHALASAGALAEQLQIRIAVDEAGSPSSAPIVQGTPLRPQVEIVAFDVPHSGFDVSVEIAFPDGRKESGALEFDANVERYVLGGEIDTASLLGDVSLTFSVRNYVYGVGAVSVPLREVRTIGLGLQVRESAVSAGKDVRRGAPVRPGTEFTLRAKVFNAETAEITSSDLFRTQLRVVESSGAVLHTETKALDGASARFSWTMPSDPAVAAGELSLEVRVVAADDAEKVYASRSVSYAAQTHMIATAITFADGVDAAHVRLGQTVAVSMRAAALANLRDVHPLATSALRSFEMLVLDADLQPIVALPGSEKEGAVRFSLEIGSSLRFVGKFQLAFRYVDASGNHVALDNFDESAGELYDELSPLSIAVDADLRLSPLSDAPESDALTFGQELSYRFRIADRIADIAAVEADPTAQARIELVLRHNGVVTARAVAAPETADETAEEEKAAEEGFFVIEYAVNPNAVAGKGELALQISRDDGTAIPLKTADGADYVRQISIGGDIEVRASTYSTTDGDLHDKSVLAANFELLCENQPLKGANLRADVISKSSGATILAGVPVSATSDGAYGLSWVQDHARTLSDTYTLRVVRDAGERERDAAAAAAIDNVVAEIDIVHTQVAPSKLPVKLQTVAFFVLIAALFYLKKFHPN